LFKTAAEDSELLIADFGLSRIIDQDKFHLLTTTCGTPGYMVKKEIKKEKNERRNNDFSQTWMLFD